MSEFSARATALVEVDPLHPDPAAIGRAAAILRAGGLVAFPTETVYGLGADATSAEAVARIFEAKGRPASDPLIVHIAGIGELACVAARVPETARRLAERFWPGPLTLVLPRAAAIPANVSAELATVAVRVPRHPVALALIRAAGRPIAAPSANLFSRPSPTRARHVLEDLGGRIDLVLDGGPAEVGVESTVLDLTVEPPAVLRPGGVSVEALREVLGGVEIRTRAVEPDEAQTSPGQLLKHYSPRAEMFLVDGPREAALLALHFRARQTAPAGGEVGVLAFDDDAELWRSSSVRLVQLGPEAEPRTVAARLFDALRALDAAGCTTILARLPRDSTGLSGAIRDRLFRAAAGRVETL